MITKGTSLAPTVIMDARNECGHDSSELTQGPVTPQGNRPFASSRYSATMPIFSSMPSRKISGCSGPSTVSVPTRPRMARDRA
jgi:hypothetical protein